MFGTKLTIPKMSNNRKIYIYRAKSADSINTIAKVKELNPIIVIDESVAGTVNVNGKKCYQVYDSPFYGTPGVTYNGPVPNIIPPTEYETSIKICQLNNYTYVNALGFHKLETNHFNGTMLYYTAIGVDEESNLITHLSKVNGVMITYEYNNGVRHIYSCDNFEDKDTDVWNYISSIEWNEDLLIGDINSPSFNRFGNPFVAIVPCLDKEKINVSLRPVVNQNFSVLEIQNPWQKNNKEFNYRKLKSFKLRNVQEEQYGEFSEPTFQSLLPVSIEKMVILRRTDSASPEEAIPLTNYGPDVELLEVIRKDGIYYNSKTHRKLGINKYNIPLGERTAIFNESSVQDTINIQIETLVAHVYTYTFYLIDVYGNASEPTVITVTT